MNMKHLIMINGTVPVYAAVLTATVQPQAKQKPKRKLLYGTGAPDGSTGLCEEEWIQIMWQTVDSYR